MLKRGSLKFKNSQNKLGWGILARASGFRSQTLELIATTKFHIYFTLQTPPKTASRRDFEAGL